MADLNRKQFWKYNQMPTTQMKMFMSAREIRATHKPLQGDFEEVEDWDDPDEEPRMETEEELWARKATEAEDDESGLYDDIVERGVQKPVHLSAYTSVDREFQGSGHERVLGGHHRIAVMSEARPDDLMPVIHHRNIFDAQGENHANPITQSRRPYPYS